jgi:hypothetical protein
VIECELDFHVGFAHAREDGTSGVAAGLDDTLQLATADDVEGRPAVMKKPQNRQVGTTFHGKANRGIQRSEGCAESVIMIEKRLSRVNVQGRSESLGNLAKVGSLAIQNFFLVYKVVHTTNVIEWPSS